MVPGTEHHDLALLLESGSQAELESYVKLLHRDEIIELLEQLPRTHWSRLLGFLHPTELLGLLTTIPETDWPELLEQLNVEQLSDVLAEANTAEVERILERTAPDEIAEVLTEMDSDDAADVLGALPPPKASSLLRQMPSQDAAKIKKLLQYPEDTAGGLMQTELIRVRNDQSVQEAINAVRTQAEAEEEDFDIYEIYVVDEEGTLIGEFSLEQLILEDNDVCVADLIEPELYWAYPSMDQEEVANFFRKYNLISLAVVDQSRHLLGRITIDDVVDVIADEASEDILQLGGTSSKDLVYDRTLKSVVLRLPWLVTNLFGGLLTGYLMWSFRATLQEIIALVTFVPVITGMGGNVGTQSSSITVRGFAIGRIENKNIRKYLLKEMRVGALMGIICGTGLSLICWIWHGNPALGLVVGLALFIAMSVAATMGTLFPTMFQWIDIDPALASGPFVTTFNDVTGILIYFSTATLFRTWLI